MGHSALYRLAAVVALPVGLLLSNATTGQACSLDNKPSMLADGRLAQLNLRQPTTSAQLATWAPFVFTQGYRVHQTIALSEDRRQLARVLTAAAMRLTPRWQFGDGLTAAGWSVRHAYARPGHWRVEVDVYYPAAHHWYSIDQVSVAVR